MSVKIDCRENQLISLCTNIISDSKKFQDLTLTTDNLHIGDILISGNEPGNDVVIERKTVADLSASIKDGRYKEQCNRLVEHYTNNPDLKVIYIIEGNMDLYFNQHNISKDKIMSCIMSLFYEKGFQVLLTKHLNETCDYLLKFCLKYYTKYTESSEKQEHAPISCLQPKKKSSQICKENIGILVCGSGMGMAMSANKHKNIRAALCYSVKNAKLSRLHNDANVITLGERLISKNLAFKCINAFLNTKFEGGRHLKRVKKI